MSDKLDHVEALFALSQTRSRGEDVSYDEIETLTKVPRFVMRDGQPVRNSEWAKLIRNWSKRELTAGRLLKWSRNGSYVICSVERQLYDETRKLQVSAERNLDKAIAICGTIKDDELDEFRQNYRYVLMQQLADTKGKSREQRNIAQTWLKRPETLPKPIRKHIG